MPRSKKFFRKLTTTKDIIYYTMEVEPQKRDPEILLRVEYWNKTRNLVQSELKKCITIPIPYSILSELMGEMFGYKLERVKQGRKEAKKVATSKKS